VPRIKQLKVYANAATPPKVAELVGELSVSDRTIRRWRGLTTTADRSHRPKPMAFSLSVLEEQLVCELPAFTSIAANGDVVHLA
jgi:hypothetical protein